MTRVTISVPENILEHIDKFVELENQYTRAYINRTASSNPYMSSKKYSRSAVLLWCVQLALSSLKDMPRTENIAYKEKIIELSKAFDIDFNIDMPHRPGKRKKDDLE